MLRHVAAWVMRAGIALQGAVFVIEFIAQSYKGHDRL